MPWKSERSRLASRPAAPVHDVGSYLPATGRGEGFGGGLGIELVQQLGPHLDEEQDLRGDSVRRAPDQPVLDVRPELEVDEAVGERRRHAVDDAAVVLAVAAGDDRGALGERVLAALALQGELVERGLDHGHAGGQLLQVEEPARRAVGGRQERGRRPPRAAVLVAPGDAPEIDGIEEERPDVDVAVAVLVGHLLRDLALAAAGRTPDDHGLPGLRARRLEGFGELGGADRVVGGYGVGIGHGRLRIAGRGRGHPPGAGPSQAPLRPSTRCAAGLTAGAPCGEPAPGRRVRSGADRAGQVFAFAAGTNGTPVNSGSGRGVDDRVWPMGGGWDRRGWRRPGSRRS